MARFIPNAQSWVAFSPTLTGTVAAPKLADCTGATNLTAYCTGLNASFSGNAVPTPAFDNLFETSIIGTNQATFTADFYRDTTADTAWTTLPLSTSGYFFIARFGGPVTAIGRNIEVWPVAVLSRTMANMANNTVVTFTVTCSNPIAPNDNATVST